MHPVQETSLLIPAANGLRSLTGIPRHGRANPTSIPPDSRPVPAPDTFLRCFWSRSRIRYLAW